MWIMIGFVLSFAEEKKTTQAFLSKKFLNGLYLWYKPPEPSILSECRHNKRNVV